MQGNDKEAGYMKASLNLGSCISSIASLTNSGLHKETSERVSCAVLHDTPSSAPKFAHALYLIVPESMALPTISTYVSTIFVVLQEICWSIAIGMFIYLTEGSLTSI